MKEFYNKKRPSKGWSGVHLLHDNTSSHKCEAVKSFFGFWKGEKVKVLNHPPYSSDLSPCDFFLFPRLNKMLSPYSSDLSPCDFFLFPRLKKMLSGNKYIILEILLAALFISVSNRYQRRLFICFSWLGKKATKIGFSKGGMLWRFVIKICLIKRSTEVIQTKWENFLQDLIIPKEIKYTVNVLKFRTLYSIFFLA